MSFPDSDSSPLPQQKQPSGNAVGRPKTVTEDYLKRLQELVSNDPRKFGYPFRRWTARWLNQHLSQEYDVNVSDRHINRLLKQMGLSTRTAYATSPSDWKPANSRITIGDLAAPHDSPQSDDSRDASRDDNSDGSAEVSKP